MASFIGETNFLAAKADGTKARLASGDMVDLAVPVSGDVTLTVRPEQVRLASANEPGALPATITNLVYFGTDTHVHLALSDGTEVTARVQSPATGDACLEKGAKAAIRFAPGAVQVVGD